MEVGVVIGRFQVDDLHEGHRFLIGTALRSHRKVVVFLGVPARPSSQENPLDYATRERMIRAAFPDVIVMPLLDRATDQEWSAQLDGMIEVITNKTGKAVLYGGRGSFVPHYTGVHKAVEVDSGIEGKSGTVLRKEIGRVVRSSSDFRAGQIYLSQNAPIRPIMGVDVACLRSLSFIDRPDEVLLGRKVWDAPGQWRFPGGKMDPVDECLEDAVFRELNEETGVRKDNVTAARYLDSQKISDWRDHGMRDLTYFSAFFVTQMIDPTQPVAGADDLVEVKWFKIVDIKRNEIVPKHDEFFDILKSYCEDDV
jgi:bifunctional NMN adenylyltransferase/nudix hydrolase